MEPMMSGLVIFDLDGTLALTSEVDDSCWIEAAHEVLGLESIETDWGHYEHSTDEAIAMELISRRTDLPPTDDTVHLVRDAFIRRVEAAAGRDPGLFRPVPGATTVFARLRDAGWQVAIATGGWRTTARLKLKVAGVPDSEIPAAHADDAYPREEIIKQAFDRAAAVSEEAFERVVYVGDGRWDVIATDRMGIGFVGLAGGDRADVLRAAGAADVRPDYLDFPAFLSAVNRRATPFF
ncbi:MAG: HAD family hydrolase [Phycisphaera sp. TMED9]|nr:MAG: HAD family hydrolase [Phycisphaera sp. TMED9]